MALTEQNVTDYLRHKIHLPKLSGAVFRRQRLLDLLHRNMDNNLQIIYTPAGYGKTTLLVSFCKDIDIPVCWYTMDDSDIDITWFVRGVIESIRLQFPKFGSSTESLLGSPERGQGFITKLAGSLIRDMYRDIPDYFLVIFDDYRLDEESDTAKLLDLFLSKTPENCHVIIAGRTNINLPTVKTKVVHNQAAVLTISDMAFTTHEIIELLKITNSTLLSEYELNKIVQENNGWIIGILLELSGQLSKRGLIESRGLSRENVFSYLMSEVYLRLPVEIQQFLLRSSILDNINPELCDHLLGINNSAQLLHEIQEKNLFISEIPLPKKYYRYHGLFRNFLKEKFTRDNPAEANLLNLKAAMMYKENHNWQEAIEHFIGAGLYSRVRELVKTTGQDFLNTGKWISITKWIGTLPGKYRSKDQELLLLQAQCDIHQGQIDNAVNNLTQIISRTTDITKWKLHARALSWRSSAYRMAGNLTSALWDIKESISILKTNKGTPESFGEAYRKLGTILLEQGKLDACIVYFKKSLKFYSSDLAAEQTAAVHNSLGIAYRELGNLTEAGMHLDLARQGWQRIGNIGALASLLNNLGIIYQCQGDYDRALKTFRSGLQNARESGYRRMEACLMISIADLLRDVEMFDEALDLYEDGIKIAEEVMEIYYIAWATAGMGETYRLTGAKEKALISLKQAISLAEEYGRVYEAALFSVRLGILEYECEEYEKALTRLNIAASRILNIGDKEALARTYFHIANIMFLTKKFVEAKNLLIQISELVEKLGYDTFLSIEGKNAVLFLQYAISEGISVNRYIRALESVRKRKQGILDTHPKIEDISLEQKRPVIEAYGLGETRVMANAHKIKDTEWRSIRALEMFFYLLSCEKPKSREQITADLWPDYSPAKSTSNFHISLYRIRHALYPGIVTHQDGKYYISSDLGIWFDVAEFSHTIDYINDLSKEMSQKTVLLQKAVDMYKGTFLPNIYSEWAENRRWELENKYIKALHILARYYFENNELTKVFDILEKITGIDPYDDELLEEIQEQALSQKTVNLLLKKYKQHINQVKQEHTKVLTYRHRSIT